jgi:hypothetical protein
VAEKLNTEGCNWADPAAPLVPVSAIVADPVFEVVTVNAPVAVPFAFDVNATPAVQLAPAASVAPQEVCVRLNGGVTLNVSPLALVLPAFEMVAVCTALD